MIDVTTVKREAIIEDAAKWFAGEMMRLEEVSLINKTLHKDTTNT